MKLWQKLSIDWPCALGDWLWAVLMMAPAIWLDKLTWRRARHIALRCAILVLLLMCVQQIVAMDMTFLFAIDAATWELLAAVAFLAARGQLIQTVRVTTRLFDFAVHKCLAKRPRSSSRQRRNANAPRRKGGIKQSDEDPAAAFGASRQLAYAW